MRKSSSLLKKKLFICVLLTASLLLVYGQVRNFQFLNFDDPTFTTGNPLIQKGVTREGIKEIFANPDYFCMQISFLSHMIDCQFFGLHPGLHHISNLLFHLLNALLLFHILQRTTGSLWKSAAVAGLFALHPINVESVAWIAERRNVLSTFFWFLALWAYIGYSEKTGLHRYALVVILFILGLMAKAMLVTLPFFLLLIDCWPLERFRFNSGGIQPSPFVWLQLNGRLLLEKIPFFVISGLASIMTMVSAQNAGGVKGIGGLVSIEMIPFSLRIANALVSYIRYVAMAFWPSDLVVYYPYPYAIPLWQAAGAGLLIALVIGISLFCIRQRPWVFVGFFWFLGTLVPVIGIVQLGGQALADRYAYVPLVGIFIMVVWGVGEIFRKIRLPKALIASAAALFFTLLATHTWLQTRYWKNSLTLFEYTVRQAPDYAVAHNNLAMALAQTGLFEQALVHAQKAVSLHPIFAEAYNNMGNIISSMGKTDEAIRLYQKALQLSPGYAEAHNNLGIAYYATNRLQKSIFHFRQALRENPYYTDAQNNLKIAESALSKRIFKKQK